MTRAGMRSALRAAMQAHEGEHPRIASVATALPAHRYGQKELAAIARALSPQLALDEATLLRFFQRAGVKERYLALEASAYRKLTGFGARNAAWLEVALTLGEHAVRRALDRAEVDARDVALLMTTTVTGLAVPSLDARLMNRVGFRSTTKRVPLFGLGCLAGVAGLARAAEYLRAYPEEAVLFLSVELCSLTVQPEDNSVANVISMGLFGDGAAAVVLLGSRHPRRKNAPKVLGSRAAFFPDTERTMGWDIIDTGFKIVLGPEVPKLAEAHVPALVDTLLAEHKLTRAEVRAWLSHPGGPAVMAAIRRGLGLSDEALARTRASLAEVGNLSSASALFILERYLRERSGLGGEPAVMIAMGPAFCAEGLLLA